MSTLLCRRCGTDIHLVTTPMETAVEVRLLPHACYRVLVAEHWEAGEVIATWNSDSPGHTGPEDLVIHHAAQADAGWQPPVGDGWTYRWQIDAEVTL